MSEGRDQLQQAIEGWEKRYSAAVVAQREADIVLPFLRAAVEELDAFRKSGEHADAVVPKSEPLSMPQPEPDAVSAPVATEPEPVAVESEPVAVELESVAVESEPVAVELEPVAVESEPVADESAPVFAAPEPVSPQLDTTDVIETTPTLFPGKTEDEAVGGLAAAILSDETEDQEDESISSAFGRKSIASLIEEAEKQGSRQLSTSSSDESAELRRQHEIASNLHASHQERRLRVHAAVHDAGKVLAAQ